MRTITLNLSNQLLKYDEEISTRKKTYMINDYVYLHMNNFNIRQVNGLDPGDVCRLLDTLKATFRSCSVLSSSLVETVPLVLRSPNNGRHDISTRFFGVGVSSPQVAKKVCLHTPKRYEQLLGQRKYWSHTKTSKYLEPFTCQHLPRCLPHSAQ